MMDRFVMRQKVVIELSFPWNKNTALDKLMGLFLMELFLTASLRGEGEGRAPMEVDPPSVLPEEQGQERKKGDQCRP